MDMSILIVKYMKDDNSLEEDLKLMSYEKSKLLDDLSYLELPIKKDILNVIYRNDDNEIMEAWTNRIVVINNNYSEEFNELLKKYNCFDIHFDNECIRNNNYEKNANL